MGDRPSHIRKAQHNLSLVNKCNTINGFNDWKITILFYACLHFVDARLAKMRIHPSSHDGRDGRNTYVSAQLRPVSGKYQTLYNRSRFARYDPDSEKHISDNEIDTIVKNYIPLFRQL